MTTWYRRIASGGAIAMIAAVTIVISPGAASAQGPLKPIDAVIINGSSNPVPVKVVTATPATLVVCTILLTGASAPTGFAHASTRKAVSSECAPGTKIDVSRILYAPDVGITSQNLASFRVTLAVTEQTQTFFLNEVVAVLTDGAPEATPIQPFRLDATGNQFVVALSYGSSGVAATPVIIGGTLIVVGTPAQ